MRRSVAGVKDRGIPESMGYLSHFVDRASKGLHGAAFVLASAAIASQALGLVRDRIFAQTFGIGRALDIYYTAFRIPDFIFVLIASLFSATVVIPFFAEARRRDERTTQTVSAHLFRSLITAFSILLVLIALITGILMPRLAEIVAPGFTTNELRELVLLSRIMLFSPFLLGLSSLFGAVTQTRGKFAVFAVGPVLYNIGIIIGVVVLYPFIGLSGLAIGVVLGALMHAGIQIPVLIREGYVPWVISRPDWTTVWRVLRTSIPRTAALGLSQAVIFVFVAIATRASSGSVAAFQFGFNIQSVPLGIIGVSYATASFPLFSRLFAEGKRGELTHRVRQTLRHIIVFSLPTSAVVIVLAEPIARAILGNGPVGAAHVRTVAGTVSFFSVSLVAQASMLVFARAFYSADDTRTPLLANALGAACALVIGLVGAGYVSSDAVPVMLAGAYTVGSAVAATYLGMRFARIFPGTGYGGAWKEGFVSGAAAAVVAFGVSQAVAPVFAEGGVLGAAILLVVAGGAAFIVGCAVLFLFGNRDITDLFRIG